MRWADDPRRSRPTVGASKTRPAFSLAAAIPLLVRIGTRRAIASATFRVLAEGAFDGDAALASAVGSAQPPRSVTPPQRPLSEQRGRAARRVRRCRDCPIPVALEWAANSHRMAPSVAGRDRRLTTAGHAIRSRARGRLPLRRLEPEVAAACRVRFVAVPGRPLRKPGSGRPG